MQKNNKAVCRGCGTPFVEDPMFGFISDPKNPENVYCETCIARGVLGDRPRTVSNRRAINLCKRGCGPETCRYYLAQTCAKLAPSMKAIIDGRAMHLTSKGDNCPGVV